MALLNTNSIYGLLTPSNVLIENKNIPPFSPALADRALKILLSYTDESRVSVKEALYDPFCGNGTILSTASILYRRRLNQLFGSDISLDALNITGTNLQLCSAEKITTAIKERTINKKPLNDTEIETLRCFLNLLEGNQCNTALAYKVFAQDITKRINRNHLKDDSLGFILTDPPYNRKIQMKTSEGQLITLPNGVSKLLDNVRVKLKDGAYIGIIVDTQLEEVSDVIRNAKEYSFTADNEVQYGTQSSRKSRHLYIAQARACS